MNNDQNQNFQNLNYFFPRVINIMLFDHLQKNYFFILILSIILLKI